jgi:hypothetical protein
VDRPLVNGITIKDHLSTKTSVKTADMINPPLSTTIKDRPYTKTSVNTADITNPPFINGLTPNQVYIPNHR